ncbi:response regulator transcription factor [Ferrimonas aestuarii]|uniref:Response regulator transcription factor n=1 Tax=Ferrimonas aestuarii TaxID=2569539 RepID=A0A4U1BJL4_9GAMM|nr:response regulator transcription factor [Ferrimonas aestuarii]TKB50741.1 response regulator transcription factor [Ferrimonas aestuarii]
MLVLLVEDNWPLANNIVRYLELNQIECDYADCAQQALRLAAQQQFDAIILDLNLPDGNGIELCQQWQREGKGTPIIMLTARGSLDERLEGFEAGADDYLVKPFALPELVARLKVVSQRKPAPKLLQLGDLKLNLGSHQAQRQGQSLPLSRTGWQILSLLAKRHPQVVTREELERSLWPDTPPDSDSLRSHVHLLRRIVDKPFSSPIIKTVRGVGLTLHISDNET